MLKAAGGDKRKLLDVVVKMKQARRLLSLLPCVRGHCQASLYIGYALYQLGREREAKAEFSSGIRGYSPAMLAASTDQMLEMKAAISLGVDLGGYDSCGYNCLDHAMMPKAEPLSPNCADLILKTETGKRLDEESRVKVATFRSAANSLTAATICL